MAIRVGHTVYHGPDGRVTVGMTLPPLPSITLPELKGLIQTLTNIAAEMNEANCLVCGTALDPRRTCKITAHEFECFQTRPDLVPSYLKAEFESLLRWKARRSAAKRGALTRGNKLRRGANR